MAVIGEKGAGKTAVADVSAFASGYPMDRKSQSSFITKGALHLTGTKVELEWGGGDRTEGVLTDNPYTSTKPRVRYLSQDFVERLCSSDHEGIELQKAIEDVVFAKLDEIQKEDYSSFSELRKAREAASNIQKEALRGELATIHKEVDRLQQAIDQRSSKVKAKAEVEQQVEELKKQLPDATQSVDQKVLEELQNQQALLKEIEGKIAAISRRRRSIEGAMESYAAIKKNTTQEISGIGAQLLEAGVSDPIAQKLLPTWTDDIDELLQREVEKLDAKIATLKGPEDAPKGSACVLGIKMRLSELQELVTKDEVSRKRLLDLQKQIAERTATSERLAKEIRNLDERVSKTLEKQKAKQVDLYLEVFKASFEI